MQFTLTCLHQSLSLSLSFCKHGLDPDQTRMVFRIECFVNLKMCACDRKYANIILWNVRLCRTKVDAHDKFGLWILIGSSCNKIDWLIQTLCFLFKETKPKQKIRVQTPCSLSLSLSPLLRPAIKVCIQFRFRRSPYMPDQGQTSIPRVII